MRNQSSRILVWLCDKRIGKASRVRFLSLVSKKYINLHQETEYSFVQNTVCNRKKCLGCIKINGWSLIREEKPRVIIWKWPQNLMFRIWHRMCSSGTFSSINFLRLKRKKHSSHFNERFKGIRVIFRTVRVFVATLFFPVYDNLTSRWVSFTLRNFFHKDLVEVSDDGNLD
jgi:hypothetical protein